GADGCARREHGGPGAQLGGDLCPVRAGADRVRTVVVVGPGLVAPDAGRRGHRWAGGAGRWGRARRAHPRGPSRACAGSDVLTGQSPVRTRRRTGRFGGWTSPGWAGSPASAEVTM